MRRLLFLFSLPLALTAGTPDTGHDPGRSSDGWFARDKAQHAVVSFIATGFSVYQLKHESGRRPGEARWTGVVFTLSLGIGKELKDRTHPGNHFCFKDLIADGIGVVAALLVVGSW